MLVKSSHFERIFGKTKEKTTSDKKIEKITQHITSSNIISTNESRRMRRACRKNGENKM
jgi:hypothetical protein